MNPEEKVYRAKNLVLMLDDYFPLMLIVGIIVGPLYMLYCEVFSGTTIYENVMYTMDIQKKNYGRGEVLRKGEESFADPISLNLLPEMNPISLTVQFKYFDETLAMKNRYTDFSATMSKDNVTIWQEDFYLKAKRSSNPNSKQSPVSSILAKAGFDKISKTDIIKIFSLKEKGTYQVNLKKGKRREIPVAILSYEIKRNVTKAVVAVYYTGFLLMIIGLTGLLVTASDRTGEKFTDDDDEEDS